MRWFALVYSLHDNGTKNIRGGPLAPSMSLVEIVNNAIFI